MTLAALDRVCAWAKPLLLGAFASTTMGCLVTEGIEFPTERNFPPAIVQATPYSTRPPRMEYALTTDGRELAGTLRLLADWGARRTAGVETLRHGTCGTPLEARWYCPTCSRVVDDPETDELANL